MLDLKVWYMSEYMLSTQKVLKFMLEYSPLSSNAMVSKKPQSTATRKPILVKKVVIQLNR